METIKVHSQIEFDAIPKDFDGLIVIEKTIETISVEARGNSSVMGRGNSSVEAWGNSHIVAWDNSHVEARDNSHVVACGNSSVEARENSYVVARGNSSVMARENSRVEARENSSVVARGNSYVVALDNSHIEAWDNSSVVAWGNSIGKAFDNSRILIINESAKFKNYMNAVIQNYVEPKYTKDIFVELAEKEKDKLVLYKSVNPETLCDFYTGKIKYELGQTVECPDWDPDESREYGGGLHLSPTARKTQDFNKGKILKCLVAPEDIVVYSGSIEKVRCRKVLPIAVVDIAGKVIEEV